MNRQDPSTQQSFRIFKARMHSDCVYMPGSINLMPVRTWITMCNKLYPHKKAVSLLWTVDVAIIYAFCRNQCYKARVQISIGRFPKL